MVLTGEGREREGKEEGVTVGDNFEILPPSQALYNSLSKEIRIRLRMLFLPNKVGSF